MKKSFVQEVPMLVEAFAKINWSLDITGILDNGYHLMDMLMQPVSLADEVTLSPSSEISISTSGYPPVRADESNIAFKAAASLKTRTGYEGGASIHIYKRIPVGAGMGGGSADAAAVLCGLNELWGLSLTGSDLESIGLTVGADVPFCLRGGLTRTSGIGDILEEHPFRTGFWIVIIQPCRGLSTREVFSLWHDSGETPHPDTDRALLALEEGDLNALGQSIGNVLRPVSVRLRPQIGAAIEALKEAGAIAAEMTGSGSAVFGIFRSEKTASSAHILLSKRWKSSFICHSQQDSLRIHG